MEGLSKLLINLKEGVVQVEGSEDFVRDVYGDFKEHISKPFALSPAPITQPDQVENCEKTDTQVSNPKAKMRRVNTAGKAAEYKPKFNNDLNLTGLAEFYDKIEPTGHNEKILIFAAFLRDKLGKASCTADDIFTCYFTMKNKTKIPEAFIQAFHNCQTRTHYIKYTSPTEVEVAIPGDNFLSNKTR
ncbi:hypothetical protein PY365_13940 [Roseiarcaceae bacterium H3SJ34-1]|uniref:hypothetical protein n=1 Tax=Terripilifer ovatus TaxID=3032367 RepID=UPI003AB92483|nr:hypothetical protein [Roseiarcaceae bacterium H3SJ34-1]